MDVNSKYARVGRSPWDGIDTEKKLFASHMGEIKELEFLVEIEEPEFGGGTRLRFAGYCWGRRGLILIVSIFFGLASGSVLVWCKSVCSGAMVAMVKVMKMT